MKKFLIVLATAILILQFIIGQNVVDKQSVTGSWLGRISAGAASLRIVFNLSIVKMDSLTATLDSPDQGAKNIKIGPVTLEGKNIKLSGTLIIPEGEGLFPSAFWKKVKCPVLALNGEKTLRSGGNNADWIFQI
jgi:hypothetical protein